MIEPQLYTKVYTRNTHILPVQRAVTPGVRTQVQPAQNTSSTNVAVSLEATVYPSRPVIDNVILAAQETARARPSQPNDVLPDQQSPARDSQSLSGTPVPGPAHTTQNSPPQILPPGTGGSNSTDLPLRTPTPSVPEFTRAQQAYTGAGAQDGRVFASSSPGETFYTGSRRTVDVLV